MKNSNLKRWISACLILSSVLVTIDGNSQDRKLPDGSIIYSDGTRRLPNGTIIYKGGDNQNKEYPNTGSVITLPDGSVIYPDGSRKNSNEEKRNHRTNKGRNNGIGLPPGQAKKVYGGSAKDYAPGQQKKSKGNGHGKGKGHKD
ncbi:hypothetical protein [Segetibacter aerophilus]|nr:hypothetical protein [Segetibacter aerophilus]